MKFQSCRLFNGHQKSYFLVRDIAPYHDSYREGGALHIRYKQGAIIVKALQ